MKKTIITLCSLTLALASVHLNAAPLGTAFTYQGRLTDAGNPANGRYDLECAVFDDASTGTQIGSVVTNQGVAVSNGLFTVSLDFGANIFTGTARWLAMGVRSNGVAANFTPLNPRQPLTPAPYAIYAGQSSTVTNGAITSTQLQTPGAPTTGQVLAFNGTSLVWQTPSATNAAWGLTGNAGTTAANFIGTSDNQALELKVNGARALRLEPNASGAPNVIGGSIRNFVGPGAVGATVAGGGAVNFYANSQSYTNRATANFATVGGGADNTSSADNSTTSGGYLNSTRGVGGTISGGTGNLLQTNASYSTISGGLNNTAESNDATVGGGEINHALGSSSTVAGGYNNTASGGAATIAGGSHNQANGDESIVSGGFGNIIGSGSSDSTIAGGRQNQIQTNAANSSIGGGDDNIIQTDHSLIGGGQLNQIQGGASYSAIGGGGANIIKPNAFGSFIGGGGGNTASGIYSTIPGGYNNEAAGPYSFAAGYQAKALHRGAFVWADSQQALFSGSLADNSVIFRCGGGVTFTSGNPFGLDQTVSWTPGSGSWSFSSDRNLKDRLQGVDPQAVLAKVSRLAISEWSYKGYPQRHIGAMAQDFHALFPLNDDDKVLNDADLHGVALAAIQGLNQKLEEALKEKDAKIAKLEKEMAGLKSAQVQASAEWDARFHTLQKAIARVADKSATTLAVNHQTREAQ